MDTMSNYCVYYFVFQIARILSVCWSHDDQLIVTGGSDSSVRVWHVDTKQNLHRLSVERVSKKKPTNVWALKMLKYVFDLVCLLFHVYHAVCYMMWVYSSCCSWCF